MFATIAHKTPTQRASTQTIGYLRLQKDVAELDQLHCNDVTWDWPDVKKNFMHFIVTYTPRNGYWKNGTFRFSFKVGAEYPHKPPEVRCLQKIYHPNIDLEGHVCLNILRDDYRPVLTISNIIHGLRFLFIEPNPTDPLNKDAAECMTKDLRQFQSNVSRAMRGERFGGVSYDRVL
ncbi:hypothetical protein GEMRC1_004869 [Eukaryota sp. GEM-RC1]